MPDRFLRSELLDSESWLACKDNADRVCWLACFLTADVFGDMPAGPLRLLRLWRPFGIDTAEKVAKVKTELADVDLIRLYEADGKPYLHIPRFGQRIRWLGKVWPLSPWATNEDKQRCTKNPPEELGGPPAKVEVVVEVGIPKTKAAPGDKSGDNRPGKWWDTVETITQKAFSIGLKTHPGETRDALYRRVRAKLDEAKIKP